MIDQTIFTIAVVGAHHSMSLFGNLFLAAVYRYGWFAKRSLYKERNIPPSHLTRGALRDLYHRWLYKPIHKKHHLFTNDCVGLTSEYNHPVEQIISTLCTLVPIMILGLDLVSTCVFLFFRTWEVLDEHCGYRFPSPFGSEHSRRHDFHHARSGMNNLGMFRFWDWLMGTNKNYKAYLKKVAQNESI